MLAKNALTKVNSILVVFVMLISLTGTVTAMPVLEDNSNMYLWVLSPVELAELEIPAGMKPEQVEFFAIDVFLSHAEEALQGLENLRDEKDMRVIDIRSDLHGILLEVGEKNIHQMGLSGRLEVWNGEKAETECGKTSMEQLERAIFSISKLKEEQAGWSDAERGLYKSGNPSVYVSTYQWFNTEKASQGKSFDAFTDVWGFADPNSQVEIRVYRKGFLESREKVWSDETGLYTTINSGYSGACGAIFEAPVPGDIVEIVANGKMSRTEVQSIQAWADPQNDTLYGRAQSGRTANFHLYVPDPVTLCSWSTYDYSASTGSGEFSVQTDVDFLAAAWGRMMVLDENQNGTVVYFYSFGLEVQDPDTNSMTGNYLPETNYTAVLSRGGVPIDTIAGTSDSSGYFSVIFGQNSAANDHVRVEFAKGRVLEMDIPPLTSGYDIATNVIYGVSGNGWKVQADIYARGNGYMPHSCNGNNSCLTVTSDASTGGYVIPTGSFDLQSGDYFYMYGYDTNQNKMWRDYPTQTPGMMVDLHISNMINYGGRISGYWPHKNVELRMNVRRVGNSYDDIRYIMVKNYYFSYFPEPTIDFTPGTVITLSETENDGEEISMTVMNLNSARLNSKTNQFSVTTPNSGILFVEYSPIDEKDSYSYCQLVNAGSSTIPLNFDVRGFDSARLYAYDSNGFGTRILRYAFSLSLTIGSSTILGIAEAQNVFVTLEQWRNGQKIYESNDNSGTSTNLWFSMESIQVEDQFHIKTTDGIDDWFSIPNLTMAIDENGVWGTSVPEEYVNVVVYVPAGIGWSLGVSFFMPADASGNYFIDGDKIIADCSERSTDPCLYGMMEYKSAVGYKVSYNMPHPEYVSEDAYESDNSFMDAKDIYSGDGYHTFSSRGDEDYAYIDISPENINPILIQTKHPSRGMGTIITIYASNETTILATAQSINSSGTRVEFTPPSSGRYYIKVNATSPGNYTDCTARYFLLASVVKNKVYLPSIIH